MRQQKCTTEILRAKLKWDGAMYNCIINFCGRALPIDETSKIFDDISFNVIIYIYGKSGLLSKAYEVLRLSRKQGLSDIISNNNLISAYDKWKDYTGMEETFQEIQHGGFDVYLEAYNSMLDAYGKSRQLKEFGNVLE
jgi:pentatricopeptide repeat protein